MNSLSKAQRVNIALAAVGFVIAGSLHFIRPEPYIRITPPYLPWHSQLVALSGFFEILGGLGLLMPRVRRAAAWFLVALLVAVFPANIYMATNPLDAVSCFYCSNTSLGQAAVTTRFDLVDTLVHASARGALIDRQRYLTLDCQATCH